MKEIRIEGEIGSWTRYDVLYQLRQAKGQPVTIKVASYGGDIGAAVAISHAIQDHGDVTVIHDSLNASAATWLPFGAKHIKMHEDCMLYVHCSSQEVFMWQQMNAEQLKELGLDIESDVRSLEAMDMMIANKYAKHSNGKYTQEQMLDLMKKHPWLTAQECLNYGFVDEIISEPSGKKVTNSMAKKFKNCAIPMPEGVEVEKTVLQKIADLLLLSSGHEGPAQPSSLQPPAINKGNSLSIITDMNKKYVTVNALLKVEGIEQSADNKLVLTAEQFQAIEDALAAAQDQIKNLEKVQQDLSTAQTAQKTAEDNLKAASDSLDTLSDDVKAVDGIDNKVALIKEMFNKIPAVQTPAPKGEEKDPYADIRKDPVNFYEDD